MNLVVHRRSPVQHIGLILGPVLFILAQFLELDPANPAVSTMAGVALLMACWWITEAIPLAATAILPMILYPLLGIMKGSEAAPLYVNSTIFLFMGGFMIALAMERWNLHRRIALVVIRTIGGGPSRIVLGFMGASAFLSMWISNTATAVMMLPIGMSIIMQMEAEFEQKDTHKFAVALMLGIAYAASMGGAATLVGTPPNLALQRVFQQTFPEAPGISFGLWFVMALPITLVMLGVIWVLLTQVFFRASSQLKVDRGIIDEEYRKVLGREPGEGGLKAALLGSTSRKVTHLATRPVLMVPMGSGSDWGDAGA